MKRLLLLLFLLLTVQPAMAWATDFGTISGEITDPIEINITEDSTLTLNNATIKGGMHVSGSIGKKLTITLIGKNSIDGALEDKTPYPGAKLPGTFALFSYQVSLEIVADSDNTEFKVNQEKQADYGIYVQVANLKIDTDNISVSGNSEEGIVGTRLELSGDNLTVTSENGPAIRAYRTTIDGDHIRIKGTYGIMSDYVTLNGDEMEIVATKDYCGIQADDGNVKISGNDILIQSEGYYGIECENYDPYDNGEPGIAISGNNVRIIGGNGYSAIKEEYRNTTWVMPEAGKPLPVYTKSNEDDEWELLKGSPFASDIQLEKHDDYNSKIKYRSYLMVGAQFQIAFDNNGGTGGMESEYRSYGALFTLGECSIIPPEGKTFAYWELNGKPCMIGDEFEMKTDMKFTAIWKDAAGAESLHMSGDGAGALPQTGDPSSLMAWVTLLGASGLGMKAVRRRKK